MLEGNRTGMESSSVSDDETLRKFEGISSSEDMENRNEDDLIGVIKESGSGERKINIDESKIIYFHTKNKEK